MDISAATLRNTLRAEKYVRWWVCAAILLGILGCVYLKEIPPLIGEIDAAVTDVPFWHLFGYYWIGLLVASIAHIGLLIWGPGMRTHWFVQIKNPSNWMISTWSLVGVILPLICGETMILDQQQLSFNSLNSASFYTLNVFCIYMAFLPAYDYQTVHMAIGIWASIVCLFARDIRLPWARCGVYLSGAVLIFLFLMFHHWVTSETTQPETDDVFSNDPEVENEEVQNDSQASEGIPKPCSFQNT